MKKELKDAIARALRAKTRELETLYPTRADECHDGRVLGVMTITSALVGDVNDTFSLNTFKSFIEERFNVTVKTWQHFEQVFTGYNIALKVVEQVEKEYAEKANKEI